MSDFFTEHLKTATEEQAKARWLGGKPGEHFRCCFCGTPLKAGDKFRVVYSNGTAGAGGNPLVCEKCNADTPTLLERWKAKHELAKTEMWWFFRER